MLIGVSNSLCDMDGMGNKSSILIYRKIRIEGS